MKSTAPTIRLDLSVLVYVEGDWWIAHCLEMDMAEEGKTPFEAFKNLVDVINHHVGVAMEEADLGSIFSPSPPELWKLFAISEDYILPKTPRKTIKPVNRFHVRQLQLA